MDRREFIKNIARGSILAGLGTITGVLVLREKSPEKCEYSFICNSCRNLSSCKLPEGLKFKEEKNIK